MLLSLVYHDKTGNQPYMSFSVWGFMLTCGPVLGIVEHSFRLCVIIDSLFFLF